MRLETFFEKFELFADAPNAVTRIRELVLELAVTGKLLAQDKQDTAASLLLASVRSERAKLVAGRKIRARSTTPVELDEQPFQLPSSWAWARLSDIGFELGQKIPDTRFAYIDVGSIDSDKGRVSDRVETLEPNDAPSRARKLVARGTVIYSTVRPYLRNIAIIDKDFDCEPIASTAFGILHPFSGISSRYLFYWLRSTPFTAYVEQGMKGMAYPAINDEKFYSGFIALPPLAEQKRIVAKVDELMALCDRLETQQQEREKRHAALARASLTRFAGDPTPANLSFLFHPSYGINPADLRKSILTLAVQGKLVPQSQDDESVVDSLIAVADVAPSEGREAGEPPFLMPSGWTWLRVADVFEVVGGIQKTPHRAPRGNAFPYLSVSNVYRGRLDLTHVKKFELEVGELERRRLEVGDLLIIEGNGSFQEIGRCASWNGEIENCVHQNHIIRCRPRDIRITPFVLLFLNSPNGVEIMQRLAITSSGLYSLSVGKIRQIEIPLPPLAEQRRIVAKVDQLMALVDQLESQLAESRAKASKLLDAVIHELLNPRAEVIEFPRSRQSRVQDRASIGCHIIQRMAGNSRFGKVMLMKLLYLSETHLDRSFGGTYKRHAAGPWDPWIDQFEDLGREQNWFSVIRHDAGDGYTKFEYRAEAGLQKRAAEAAALLGDQQAEFDRVLDLFTDKTREQAEIIATLFAAWNDALIDGLQPTDGEIIREVRERWHPDKARFTSALLQRWLAWMRAQKLVPRGLGRRTVQQTQLPLH